MELERAAMERLVRRQAELERAERALAADRTEAERAIAHSGVFESQDLQTLSAYQARSAREMARLRERRQALQLETAAQMTKSMEAQRRVKLMERLREQRLQEWQRASDAAQESFAAEAWLGRWPMLKKDDDEFTAAVAPRPRLGTQIA